MSTTDMLFTGEETVTALIGEYEARLDTVQQAIAERHQHLQLRYAMDEQRATQDRIRGARNFLAGEYDRTYCSGLGYETVQDWRIHYALDSLRTALHDLVWAEHYAGLRDREATRELDPWNQR
jgi:hypothetical protein